MEQPFRELGSQLKAIRHKQQETIAEVAVAVEVDIESLAKIENGQERPSEDVLMLLMSHFNLPDDDAVRLWEMANYDRRDLDSEEDLQSKTIVMLSALDARILYSDGINVAVNKSGVVMNFFQGSGKQQLPVSRIGMSFEQAGEVLSALGQAIDQARFVKQPKALPARAPKISKKKSGKNR